MHPSAEFKRREVNSSADMAQVSALVKSAVSSEDWKSTQLALRRFHLRGLLPKTGFSWCSIHTGKWSLPSGSSWTDQVKW